MSPQQIRFLQKGFESTEYLWLYNVKYTMLLNTDLKVSSQVQIPVSNF